MRGHHGQNGGPKGDLYIVVHIKHHPIYVRKNENVYCNIPVTVTQATLGAELEIPMVDGSKEKFKIPEGTQTNTNFKIKQKGFIISIDDFGTGYSSLSMLQNMPIDIIKIDKIFVDKADLTSNKNIINYIMILANRLGVKTIVEGVETQQQVDFVRNLKCDMIQGYYYSKPLNKEDFTIYFNTHK